jgi:hypothetical protein
MHSTPDPEVPPPSPEKIRRRTTSLRPNTPPLKNPSRPSRR